eukprot:15365492-Ditylum_brightwellii.AAC.1
MVFLCCCIGCIMSACTVNKDNEVRSSRGRCSCNCDNEFMSFGTASFGGTLSDTGDTDYRTYDDTETNYTSALDVFLQNI